MLKTAYKKLLNPTEQQAITKLLKMHEPMIRELEKWKDQREKLESHISNQIDTLGRLLGPLADQSQWEKTLSAITGQRTSRKYPNKKTASKKSSSKKKSSSRKKSR